ncbi:peptidoglycan-binding domain-containing protein [Streptomyces sp. NPDC050803]|uniref:peptidoglycan-binding domain-containing protein n=1 Tax=unclassified Streptomyces TaxID=2593676 RepID=UPI003429D2F2
MNLRTHRAKLATVTLGTALAGVLAFGTSPASASASAGAINGSGTHGNDWEDEGTLTTTSYAQTNATCLWQRILSSEGVNRASGSETDFAISDIDGIFGKKTAYASAQLQKRWGLTTDAKIGPKTWTKASTHLKYVSGSTAAGGTLKLKYVGKTSSFAVTRNTKGFYQFYQDGGTRVASYKYRTCS